LGYHLARTTTGRNIGANTDLMNRMARAKRDAEVSVPALEFYLALG